MAFISEESRNLNLAATAIASLSQFGVIFFGGTPNGSMPPISSTAERLLDTYLSAVPAAASALQATGMSPTVAGSVAAVAVAVAPVAGTIALGHTGKLAIEVAYKGVSRFWNSVSTLFANEGRATDLRRKFEALHGRIDAITGRNPDFGQAGSYIVRTENGHLHEVDRKTYLAFRKEIARGDASVILRGNCVDTFQWGKLVGFDRVPIRDEVVIGNMMPHVFNGGEKMPIPWPVVDNAWLRFSIASAGNAPSGGPVDPNGPLARAQGNGIYVLEGGDAYPDIAGRLGFTQNEATGRWERPQSAPLSPEEIRRAAPELEFHVETVAKTALRYDPIRSSHFENAAMAGELKVPDAMRNGSRSSGFEFQKALRRLATSTVVATGMIMTASHAHAAGHFQEMSFQMPPAIGGTMDIIHDNAPHLHAARIDPSQDFINKIAEHLKEGGWSEDDAEYTALAYVDTFHQMVNYGATSVTFHPDGTMGAGAGLAMGAAANADAITMTENGTFLIYDNDGSIKAQERDLASENMPMEINQRFFQ